MDIEHLLKRMEKAGPGLESGFNFLGREVVLWWQVSKLEKHYLVVDRAHITVLSSDFQKQMMKAQSMIRTKMIILGGCNK